MPKKIRSPDQDNRVKDQKKMTTIAVSRESKDAISALTDWLELKYYTKTGKKPGFILNDGVKYLLTLIDFDSLDTLDFDIEVFTTPDLSSESTEQAIS